MINSQKPTGIEDDPEKKVGDSDHVSSRNSSFSLPQSFLRAAGTAATTVPVNRAKFFLS
jgi:hypothetical protein